MANFGLFRGFSEKLFEGELPINLGMVKADFDDSDVLAFFTRVTDAGGTLSDTQKLAVLNFTGELKAYGIWDKMKAIYPIVGASAESCAQNLKSSSFTGAFSGGWTFTSNGMTGNGTNASMQTGLIPSVQYADEKISFSQYAIKGTGGSISMGAQSPFAYDWRLGSASVYNNSGVAFADGTNNGFRIVTRNNTTQIESKMNANLTIVALSDFVSRSTQQFTLGSMNDGFYSDNNIRFASIGDNLTIQNQTDLYNAVQAFQTTLGRQV
jgi:hypothetical protein